MIHRNKTATKTGQSGIELMALVAFSMFLMAGVYVSFLHNNASVRQAEVHMEGTDIAQVIAFEISSAVQVGHGYERNFTIPSTVLGTPYTIVLDEGFIVINTSDQAYIVATVVDNITGTLVTGANTIKNIDGFIYVNQ